MMIFKLLALVCFCGTISASASNYRIIRESGKLDRIEHFKADDEVIPESFDAREKWPNCQSIKLIRDNSLREGLRVAAVVAASVMSDRVCIASNGTDQTLISDEDLMSCCNDYCYWGDYETNAWTYWNETGIVSGGPYNSTSGCKAYSMEPCDHLGYFPDIQLPKCYNLDLDDSTPECSRKCDDGSPLDYKESITYGSKPYSVGGVEQIQLEIMRNGPVHASIIRYENLLTYGGDVYTKMFERGGVNYSVRIIGWGMEGDVPYWLVALAWNDTWGLNGLMKFMRGTNECGIEYGVIAGMPLFK